MKNGISIRRAVSSDVEGISDCVMSAYDRYIPIIGKPPGPMLYDYVEIVRNHLVFVVEAGRSIVGVLVLTNVGDGIMLDNVAVHPSHQGQGVGKRLMVLAEDEAMKQGYTTIQLDTHEKMIENISMYENMGYVELERRREGGYDRIYMRKQLREAL